VAFGTSAPEMVVNIIASISHHNDIVYGNILGSNNFNLFVILGIAAIIYPLKVQKSTVWKEIPISFVAILMFFMMSNDFLHADKQVLSRIDGFILLVMFFFFQLYIYNQIKSERSEFVPAKDILPFWKIILLIIVGLGGLVLGGRMVVNNAVIMAQALGVSEKIIGLTIIAAGTSLPELATSVVAAVKKNADIAVGNIIGSNIFNIFFIGGVVSLINPVEYNRVFNTDFYMLSLGTIMLFIMMFTSKKENLDRWEAALLFLIYAGYTVFLITKEI
jgi:cation:H+ antiporter